MNNTSDIAAAEENEGSLHELVTVARDKRLRGICEPVANFSRAAAALGSRFHAYGNILMTCRERAYAGLGASVSVCVCICGVINTSRSAANFVCKYTSRFEK